METLREAFKSEINNLLQAPLDVAKKELNKK